ncbi:MAG: peptidoglycan DD-metalloendopeptidase family protein [Pseudomonadaceae bacterium]|nr:peptidoglycan DD-metalloendopeptidase family protein [Pseudomonadaceae bacterium]
MLYRWFAASACALVPLTAFAALTLHDAHTETSIGPRAANPFTTHTALPPITVERTLELGRGETLSHILARSGLTVSQQQAMLQAAKGTTNLSSMKAGTEFTLSYTESAAYQPDDVKLSFREGPTESIHLAYAGGQASAKVQAHKLEKVHSVAVGHIANSLYVDATRAGLPAALIKPFTEIFAWDLDYTRDIHPGDTFKVTFEEVKDDRGNRVKSGRILAASFTVKGKTQQAFWFEDSYGRGDYYNEKGEGKRKLLLRTPLEVYRISSGFNLHRKHPVLGYTRAHKGTDFAAPTGTPVKASGDGVVTYVGRHGGHGNFVKIKHAGGFETAYAHLSRYAKGLRKGQKVKQGQVVAYVGSTGVSTGPHLHYEVIQSGRHVNPMSTKLPTGTVLASKDKSRFSSMVASITTTWRKALTQLADNAPLGKRG